MTRKGRGKRRAKPIDRAVKAREDQLLQAILAYQANRFTQAEELCCRLIHDSPKFAPAKLLFAMIVGKTGRPQLGIDSLRAAISDDPHYLEPHVELAGLLTAQGQVAAAIVLCEQALQHWPGAAGLYNMLGVALMTDGRTAEAIGTFQRAAALDANLAIAQHNLGLTLQFAGRDHEAITAYRRAIALAPGYVDSYAQLAHLFFALGRRDEGREQLRLGSAAQENSVVSRLLKAELVLGEGRLTEAEAIVQAIVEEDSRSAAAHHLLAIVQQQAGQFAEAHTSYERTVALSPQRTTALLGLVMSGKLSEADRPVLARLVDLLQSRTLAETSRAEVHYALGKGFDDLSEFEQAMRHFDAANAIVGDRVLQLGMRFDHRQHHDSVSRMIEIFTADFFSRRGGTGHDSALPVLIVGMPRSGTTLVEQIVSSHPEIGAAGEQHFWPNRTALVGQVMADLIPTQELRRAAEEYCGTLQALSLDAQRVTDKMPANFLLLGLIHLALPNARIIHCRRHAVDTCLSLYSTPFSNLVNFAHDREDIVDYYREYARLMAHWRRVLPAERFIEIDYERLVADQEGVSRRMINFCGLEWNEACLQHECNPHAIHTPSWWQARQPVYQTSVGRWRRYETWLGTFRQLLDGEDRADQAE